jgi:hypothetical protein
MFRCVVSWKVTDISEVLTATIIALSMGCQGGQFQGDYTA